MSRKFCAVFPTGRKKSYEGLHFSYRQEKPELRVCDIPPRPIM